MQRITLSNFYFLLATLLIFVAGCEEALLKPPSLPSTIISKDGAEMILIPAGEFIMGSPEGEGDDNEHPQYKVFLDAFYIDKYEVTNAQYKQFVDATGHKEPPYYWNDERYNQPNQPVVGVTWDDAESYAEWAGKRLPTEAEWEKASRGTDGRRYPWGNEWDSLKCNSNVGGDDYEYTTPVGSFPDGASPYGVMDMAGNVWEWCADRYGDNYYSRSPQQNPMGPDSGNLRVLRGGSWDDTNHSGLRCAVRGWSFPDGRGYRQGFSLRSGRYTLAPLPLYPLCHPNGGTRNLRGCLKSRDLKLAP